MSQKIMLLGASGQLGSEWARYLQKTNINYTAYSHKDLDITNSDKLRDVIEVEAPDVIINCAAYTKVDQAEDEPELARKINAQPLTTLCEVSKENDILLVHYSTDYVFPGLAEDRIKYPGGYPEDHPVDPINTYGKTKLEGENIIRSNHTKHLIIRVSWLCGSHGHNFVKTMIRLGAEREKLRIVNDQFGSPSFAKNVVENSIELVNGGYTGTFNITSKGTLTWYDLTCEIFRLMGYKTQVHPISSEEFPTKAVRPHFSKLDTTKLEKIPGSHLISWKDGLKEFVNELNKT